MSDQGLMEDDNGTRTVTLMHPSYLHVFGYLLFDINRSYVVFHVLQLADAFQDKMVCAPSTIIYENLYIRMSKNDLEVGSRKSTLDVTSDFMAH